MPICKPFSWPQYEWIVEESARWQSFGHYHLVFVSAASKDFSRKCNVPCSMQAHAPSQRDRRVCAHHSVHIPKSYKHPHAWMAEKMCGKWNRWRRTKLETISEEQIQYFIAAIVSHNFSRNKERKMRDQKPHKIVINHNLRKEVFGTKEDLNLYRNWIISGVLHVAQCGWIKKDSFFEFS